MKLTTGGFARLHHGTAAVGENMMGEVRQAGKSKRKGGEMWALPLSALLAVVRDPQQLVLRLPSSPSLGTRNKKATKLAAKKSCQYRQETSQARYRPAPRPRVIYHDNDVMRNKYSHPDSGALRMDRSSRHLKFAARQVVHVCTLSGPFFPIFFFIPLFVFCSSSVSILFSFLSNVSFHSFQYVSSPSGRLTASSVNTHSCTQWLVTPAVLVELNVSSWILKPSLGNWVASQ